MNPGEPDGSRQNGGVDSPLVRVCVCVCVRNNKADKMHQMHLPLYGGAGNGKAFAFVRSVPFCGSRGALSADAYWPMSKRAKKSCFLVCRAVSARHSRTPARPPSAPCGAVLGGGFKFIVSPPFVVTMYERGRGA